MSENKKSGTDSRRQFIAKGLGVAAFSVPVVESFLSRQAQAVEPPGQGKQGGGKTGEGKTGEGKMGEGKCGEGKMGEGKQGGGGGGGGGNP